MEKQRKKRKRKSRIPALSRVDRGIYFGLFIASMLPLLLFGWLCVGVWPHNIAFQDPTVVAYAERWTLFFILPLLLYAIAPPAVLLETLLTQKQPLFGRRDIVYTAPPYPLLGKQRQPLPSPGPALRRQLCLWLAGLFLCLLLFPLGLYGRICLTADHTVRVYNSFNQITDTREAEELTELHLSVHCSSGKSGSRWACFATLHYGDTYYDFELVNFRRENGYEDALSALLRLKKRMPLGTVSVIDAEQAYKVVEEYGLNSDEAALLNELLS